MRLYAIRNKWTGQFLEGSRTGAPQWGPSPTYWKKPDTVKRHLHRVATRHVFRRDGKLWAVRDRFDPERLQHLEVTVTDVSILGEHTLPVAGFVAAGVAHG